jgi:hypothetical protein
MVSALTIVQAVSLLELLVGVAIVGLAVQGYRRNRSQAMLFLGAGIATLTLVGTAVQILVGQLTSTRLVAISVTVTDLLGMCLILYAIVLARRE